MKRSCMLFILMLIFFSLLGCLNPAGLAEKDIADNAAISRSVGNEPKFTLDEVIDYYKYWSNKYLKSWDGSDQYYYVDQTYDFEQGWITGEKNTTYVSTSEAMGYGMLITSMIGIRLSGAERQKAKKYFDGLYRLYKKCPSTIKLPGKSSTPLMSWLVPKHNSGAALSDSATDGDIDIAYGLLIAHMAWGSDGEINYIKACGEMIKAISLMELDTNKNITLLGDWAHEENINPSSTSRYKYASRPCDWMVGKLEDLRWYLDLEEGIDVGYDTKFINGLISNLGNISNRSGLVPDFVWIDYLNGATRLSPVPGGAVFNGKSDKYKAYSHEESAYFIESEHDDDYYWNSCRVPMRMAYPARAGIFESEARRYIDSVASQFYFLSNGDPNNIYSGYDYYTGAPISTEKGDGAFVSPVIAAVKASWVVDENKKNSFLSKGLAYWRSSAVKPAGSNYFADSITMQSMMIYVDLYCTTVHEYSTVADWQVGVSYSVGDKVRYNGSIWTCTFSHTSNSAWYPGAPGLWFWKKN